MVGQFLGLAAGVWAWSKRFLGLADGGLGTVWGWLRAVAGCGSFFGGGNRARLGLLFPIGQAYFFWVPGPRMVKKMVKTKPYRKPYPNTKRNNVKQCRKKAVLRFHLLPVLHPYQRVLAYFSRSAYFFRRLLEPGLWWLVLAYWKDSAAGFPLLIA